MGIVESIEAMRARRLKLGERAYRRERAIELLEHGMSLAHASELIGCARKTLYNDCKDPEFAERVKLARERGRLTGRKDRPRREFMHKEWPAPRWLIDIPRSPKSVYRVEQGAIGAEQRVTARVWFWRDGKLIPTRKGVTMKPGDARKVAEAILRAVEAATTLEAAQER